MFSQIQLKMLKWYKQKKVKVYKMNDKTDIKRGEFFKFVLWDVILYGGIAGLGIYAYFKFLSEERGLTLISILAIVVTLYFAGLTLSIIADIILGSVILINGKIRIAYSPSERKFGLYTHIVEVSKSELVRVRMSKTSDKYKDEELTVYYGKLSKQVLKIDKKVSL